MSTRARARVVVDTNALVSRLLLPRSIPGQAVRKAVADGQLLASDSTIMELADVLGRPKFDPYVTIRERQEFLRLFNRIADRIPITRVIQVCRDPKDDKFLELAVNGTAQLIITGDADLLALHPFRGIEILTPGSYLVR
ncbi:MAG: putative toxin-antitoxin system toxin component, PIN family [Alphaproteobacteria bacterium]|nr:putative toxin-antitoxin system toxin component, PIN family [Alphaproteobacteria bacterium]